MTLFLGVATAVAIGIFYDFLAASWWVISGSSVLLDYTPRELVGYLLFAPPICIFIWSLLESRIEWDS